MKKLVSCVIPCYRSEATLPGVVREIQETMEKMDDYAYEVVMVNDCSPDHTYDTIKRLCQENENMKGIELAKNFGQHSALMAGFHYVKEISLFVWMMMDRRRRMRRVNCFRE